MRPYRSPRSCATLRLAPWARRALGLRAPPPAAEPRPPSHGTPVASRTSRALARLTVATVPLYRRAMCAPLCVSVSGRLKNPQRRARPRKPHRDDSASTHSKLCETGLRSTVETACITAIAPRLQRNSQERLYLSICGMKESQCMTMVDERARRVAVRSASHLSALASFAIYLRRR
jgi:hypothetical protein